ncbi:MAG: ECF-type sigma factor [Longimicrobiales bacterium]|nr:ECF-type sigma factor [Longimicrobiales bacterium]
MQNLPSAPEPGDRTAALHAVFTRVYRDLHRLAHHLRGAGVPGSLGTTSLVHEAYLKLRRSPSASWEDERHFIRLAARAMRQLLMDAAAARRAAKRGGGERPGTLPPQVAGRSIDLDALLDIDRALDRLGDVHPRAAQVLELRFFVGLSVEETAEALGISPPTVKRDWRLARAWIRQEVRPR